MTVDIANIEFYNTPEGEVMMKELNQPAVILGEDNRSMIEYILSVIRDRYPKAHTRLMKLYSGSTMNRRYYEFRVVHRFIRCNFGEYDQHDLDGKPLTHSPNDLISNFKQQYELSFFPIFLHT